MGISNGSRKLRNATLVFLVKKNQGKISDICLAMKKRGFGIGRWNGAGGKVGDNHKETVIEAARREAKEEIGVDINIVDFYKVAELTFYFPRNPAWDQLVHVYFTESWSGEPAESEEMSPKWFPVSEIPYRIMWPDDEFWLPEALKSNLLKATFKFGENDVIFGKEINICENLEIENIN
ncbi:8-oxo-dGTP diphosphatase [Patescibacteria group bacterium]|nr:8-oxo-dGTP diphosphatase [Patescibacteria group bacterium]